MSIPVSIAHAVERGRNGLAGDAMERERERVDRAGDQVGAGTRGFDRIGEAAAGRALAVADGQPDASATRDTSSPAWCGWSPPVGSWISARRVQLRQLARLLDERVRGPLATRAVDETGMELLARGDDRLAGLAQVGDVVERVVEPEDVDPVLGRGGDETADEIGSDGP